MAVIHHFTSSSEAYDATQCDAQVRTGDALLIAQEGIVGLAWTWPVAVTAEAGDLHELTDADTCAPANIIQDAGWTDGQLQSAAEIARQLGLPLAGWVQESLGGRAPGAYDHRPDNQIAEAEHQ